MIPVNGEDLWAKAPVLPCKGIAAQIFHWYYRNVKLQAIGIYAVRPRLDAEKGKTLLLTLKAHIQYRKRVDSILEASRK